MSRRTQRVNDLLREELTDLIRRGVKDPRVGHGLVTITEVEASPDLKHATVYASPLGDDADRDDVLAGLAHAARYLRAELVHRLSMRSVPELRFRFDPSI